MIRDDQIHFQRDFLAGINHEWCYDDIATLAFSKNQINSSSICFFLASYFYPFIRVNTTINRVTNDSYYIYDIVLVFSRRTHNQRLKLYYNIQTIKLYLHMICFCKITHSLNQSVDSFHLAKLLDRK